MPNPDQATCALRALNLCDDDRVVDYRGAPDHRVECYCKLLALALEHDLSAVASGLRTDRARTVARSSELQRTTTRHQQLLGDTTGRPPF